MTGDEWAIMSFGAFLGACFLWIIQRTWAILRYKRD